MRRFRCRCPIAVRFLLAAAAVAPLAVFDASAQAYPSRPIRIIVPSGGSGAGSDLYARLIGRKLTEAWGQQVVIDNRPGAGGSIGAQLAARSPPDGYTLMLAHPNQMTVGAVLRANNGYDPLADFAPVTLLMTAPSIWTVHPSSAIGGVADLVAAAKKRPGDVSYGTSGVGSVGNLIGQLFSLDAGIRLHHVPYKGAAPAVLDLVSNRIDMVSAALAAQIGFIRDGKLKPIATTGLKRARLTPNVPTIAEQGYPGFDVTAWHGVVAPAKTAPEIIGRLNQAIVRIVGQRDVQEILWQEGGDIAPTTPAEFATLVRNEHAKWVKVVKQLGISAE